MLAYWLNDGRPLDDGRFCRVTDLEDGTGPIKTYGRTQEEVFEKIERTMMTAQETLSRLRNGGAQSPNNSRGAAPPAAVAQDPAILNADETMRLTADLQNPAKAADASLRLSNSARAVQQQKVAAAAQVAMQWAQVHPEFFVHRTNQTLLMNKALLTVGGDYAKITAEVLDLCFRDLQAGGYLLTENDVAREEEVESTLAAQPGGSPEPVQARSRNAVVSTTGHRSTRLGGSQLPRSWTPKYTREQLEKLPTKESDRLIRSGDKDYREACDYWWGSKARATA